MKAVLAMTVATVAFYAPWSMPVGACAHRECLQPAAESRAAAHGQNSAGGTHDTARASAGDIPVKSVRTTREAGDHTVRPIDAGSTAARSDMEYTVAPSLMTMTIMRYLGGPARIEQAHPASTEAADRSGDADEGEISGDAQRAYAQSSGPDGAPQLPGVALEYILLTFAAALATAAAIRAFVVQP
jgi:hypothetical protein